MNKAAKRYMKELKLLLTLRGKKEKQLFQSINFYSRARSKIRL